MDNPESASTTTWECRVMIRWTEEFGGHVENARPGRTGDETWAERVVDDIKPLIRIRDPRIEAVWVERRPVSPWEHHWCENCDGIAPESCVNQPALTAPGLTQ